MAVIFLERADEELPTKLVKSRVERGQPVIVVTSEPALVDEALQDATAGCRRALHLLGNLLDVARSEAGRFTVQRNRVRNEPMLREVAHDLATRVRGRGIAIRVDAPPDIELDADLELLRRAVENVLDNAVRYVPQEGEIAIAATQSSDTIELRIGNSGPAVPERERERIFDKYERGKHGGQVKLGLGLHFCRLVARRPRRPHQRRIRAPADGVRLPSSSRVASFYFTIRARAIASAEAAVACARRERTARTRWRAATFTTSFNRKQHSA